MKIEMKNALEFIEESILFKNPDYQWILPLITYRLEDNIPSDEFIFSFIDSLLPELGKFKISAEYIEFKDKLEVTIHPPPQKLARIKSINHISNIGLLEVSKAIAINDALTIFYGRNGSGKSSIFIAICKLLGINKPVFHNVNFDNKNSSCSGIAIDADGNSFDVEWNSNSKSITYDVKYFDSEFSNLLVRSELSNEFKLTSLKTEYFYYLHDIYNTVEKRIENIKSELDLSRTALVNKLGSINPFILGTDYSEDEISHFSFAAVEETRLQTLERDFILSSNDGLEQVIQVLQAGGLQINQFLLLIGKYIEIGNNRLDYKLTFDEEHFKNIQNTISLHTSIKKRQLENLDGRKSILINSDWIGNDLWFKFIKSSIDFVESLEKDKRLEFKEKTCIYCSQSIQTQNAKNLIELYYEIQKDYASNLEDIERKLSTNIETLSKAKTSLANLQSNRETVVNALAHLKDTTFSLPDADRLQKSITEIIKTIEDYGIIDFNNISTFIEVSESYSTLNAKLNEIILEKKSLKNNSEIKRIELKQEIDNLKLKKVLFENKIDIENLRIIKQLYSQTVDISKGLTKVRQQTSRLETDFSKDAAIELFKSKLEQEYEFFEFNAPEKWTIKSKTGEGRNKRYYKIGDFGLAEILSEGERKIHSLADFFAEANLKDYKGIYIFDDPVNSLDEKYISLLSKRVKKLIEEGNQVILFTHNILFLNYLVDVSKDKIYVLDRFDKEITFNYRNADGTNRLKTAMSSLEETIENIRLKEEKMITTAEYRTAYDMISGYLEDYIENVMLADVVCRYRNLIRVSKLTSINYEIEKASKLKDIYDNASDKGFRHSHPIGVQPPSKNELLRDFDIIKENFYYR